MKASELRIGNFVRNSGSGSHAVVFEVLESSVGARNVPDNNHIQTIQVNGALNPIPITDEWLVKFNFQYCDSKITGKGQKLAIQITNTEYLDFEDNEFFISNVNDNRVVTFWQEIKYVHQLQNLYFGVTGEELMIKE